MPNVSPQSVTLAARGQVLLERYKQGVIDDIAKILQDADKVIRLRLSGEQSAWSRARLEAQLAGIRAELAAVYARAGNRILEGAKDAGPVQAAQQASAIQATVVNKIELAIPSPDQIFAAATARPFTVGKTPAMLDTFVKKWASGSVDAAENTIRLGALTGRTNAQIVQDLRGTRAAKWQDGIIGTTYKNAMMVTRTAVQHVATTARLETMAKNADIVKGYQWVSVLDDRTTEVCRSLSGQTYKVGEGPLPPQHIGCLTGDSVITACNSVTGVSKRWFDGEIVIIETAAGRKLSCTPNHPILTTSGWVAAGLLDNAHKVVCRPAVGWTAFGKAQNNDCPSTISDITESFLAHSRVLSVPVPTSAPDFHGDGAGSDIAIIGANRSLLSECDPSICEQPSNIDLISRNGTGFCKGASPKLFGRIFALPSSGVRFFSKCGNLCCGIGSHAGKLLLGAVALFKSDRFKHSFDWLGACTYRLGDSCDANPSGEHVGDFIDVDSLCGPVMFRFYRDSAAANNAINNAMTDAQMSHYLSSGLSGQVEFDDVVSNKRVCFSGHVYNLETVGGNYTANGIITHNCRSTIIADLDSRFDFLDAGATQASKGASGGKQVSADLTYYDWLKTQPAEFQDVAIGPMRGALLRDGGLSSERFAELNLGRNFQPLTLAEMERLEPTAFGRAGIEITEKGRAVFEK